MKITKHTVTSLAYELKVEGKLADKADEQQPLEYIHGTNML
ncbi:MAG: peptidylprolyl isomerase, partial [Rikenellaceae bacterium]|nr:peptidylprolyl isomerase [Rikenellaceae bacterium]